MQHTQDPYDAQQPDTRPRWYNSLGEEVNLDDIDREYALNIYTMVVFRRGADLAVEMYDLRHDLLVEKLRKVILTGRKPNLRDRLRAQRYNRENRRRGLPYRADTDA